MTEILKSASFPHGLPAMGTEAEARARLSMVDVINAGARKAHNVALPCPWCGTDPGLPVYRFKAFYVGCESDDCGTVQFAGATPEEAVARWNARRG